MYDYTGWIVRSVAGHDKGELFCVVGVDQERGMLLLADGKRRRAARPKAKKLGHVQCLADHQHPFQHPAVEKLRQGNALTDKELRRTLAAFRDRMEV